MTEGNGEIGIWDDFQRLECYLADVKAQYINGLSEVENEGPSVEIQFVCLQFWVDAVISEILHL